MSNARWATEFMYIIPISPTGCHAPARHGSNDDRECRLKVVRGVAIIQVGFLGKETAT